MPGTQFEMKIKPPRRTQGWSYSSHRESSGKALSSPGIGSNKNTHINCASSARMAVRSMAGFPTYDLFYYLARASLNPPISLCKKLFPAIGEWHDRLAAKELSPGDPIQPTVAENAFIQVIMMFRKTFIQDSVLMMEPTAIAFGDIQSSLIQPICHSKGKSTS
ncbi:hypothetical protein [Absidia glauca]|uniref:Ndc10 domain-containing protein n=1 Tax=Absidia glauca TaxID=4829 RepID=A0A168MEE0_ABSGL|nr:hypothetical protein [Absidia glauca]